jgi:hypothetical protein
LRHAEKRVDFRENRRERAAIAQHPKKFARVGLAQRLFGFLPDAFRDQGIDLVPIDHRAHQRQCFGRDMKAERSKAGRKPRDTQ